MSLFRLFHSCGASFFYFFESMLVSAETGEFINITWGPNCMPAEACMLFLFHSFCGCGLTPLKCSTLLPLDDPLGAHPSALSTRIV